MCGIVPLVESSVPEETLFFFVFFVIEKYYFLYMLVFLCLLHYGW